MKRTALPPPFNDSRHEGSPVAAERHQPSARFTVLASTNSVTKAGPNPDSRFSLTAARLGIAASAIWMLTQTTPPASISTRLASAHSSAYRPVGIMSLVSPDVPPTWAMLAVWWVALVSTCLWLVGRWTRSTAVVSLAATLIICTFNECFSASGWSHGNNFILLAQIAFLPAAFGTRTRYPVYLVQFALGAALLSAAFSKLHTSGLAWVFSDNLRMILVTQYPGLGRDMPSYLQPVADSLPLWQALAVGNLIAQMVPITSTFLTRYPRLRAIGGLFFVMEVLALGVVMNLWNPQWLLLAVVFFDWDALVRWSRKVRSRPAPSGSLRRPPLFAVLYVLVTVVIGFSFWRPNLDYEWNTYPFSAFPMYSSMYAGKPYDEHVPYRKVTVLVRVSGADLPLEEKRAADLQLTRRYRTLTSLQTRPDVGGRLLETQRDATTEFSQIDRVDLVRATLEVPAYPEPAVPTWTSIELLGSVDEEGHLTTGSAAPVYPPVRLP